MSSSDWIIIPTIGVSIKFHGSSHHQQVYQLYPQAIGSMYDIYIYGNIYHQYTPNVSIYTIHGSYGQAYQPIESNSPTHQPTVDRHRRGPAGPDQRPNSRRHQGLKSRWTKLQQHSNWSGFIALKIPKIRMPDFRTLDPEWCSFENIHPEKPEKSCKPETTDDRGH